MSEPLPALCLIAVPGRRRRTIELCQETERRGFAGIYVPSPFGNISMCEALAWNTGSIAFGTAIAPIYQRTIVDFAQSAAMMFLYVFINTAMVMGLLPVVGVPLPLVSNGGTAMLSVMFACGLLIGVNVYRDALLPRAR